MRSPHTASLATLTAADLLSVTSSAMTPVEEKLLGEVRVQLKADRIAPASRKLSIKHYARAQDYFRDKPHDDYWNTGRRAVGARAVYGISYSPTRPMLGGVGTFLFDAKTHKFLWAYRGR